MGKYFFKPDEHNKDSVVFTGKTAFHMHNVLRYKVGQEIVLCDGNCTDYVGRLESITKKPLSLTFTILKASPCFTESSIHITLHHGIPKGDKMDWIIEKCIELGVSDIVPVYTARTVVKIKDVLKKTARFTKLAESAASQCLRGIIPVIHLPQSFEEAITTLNNNELILTAYEKEQTRSIKSVLAQHSPRSVSLWIGPEGGFEDSEVTALIKKGAITVSLGSRILRTETAGLAAIAQILCLWDETK